MVPVDDNQNYVEKSEIIDPQETNQIYQTKQRQRSKLFFLKQP